MATAGHIDNPDGFPGSSSTARAGLGRMHLGRPRLVTLHPPRGYPTVSLTEVALGASALGLGVAGRVLRVGGSVVRPAVAVALRPPLVPSFLQPARVVDDLGRLGAEQRRALEKAASGLLDALVPRVVAEVLGRVNLTDVVLHHVDLDAVVAGVDLDAAAARLDVDSVAARLALEPVISRVDVNAVAATLDVDAVLDRLGRAALVQVRVGLHAMAAQLER